MTTPEPSDPQAGENKASTLERSPADDKASERAAQPNAANAVPTSHAPILDERHVGRFDLLFQRPPAQVYVSRICVRADGSQVRFSPDKQPTAGELFWGHIRTIYDVDLRLHCTALTCQLPSARDTFSFQADIDLHWQVERPDTVVKLGITDVRQTVAPVLLARLRKVTRQCLIEDSEEAEEAANKEVGGDNVGAEFGLTVRPFVRLSMDADSIEFAARERRIKHFDAIIRAGEFSQFALLLAQDAKHVFDMIKSLSNSRATDQRTLLSFISALLDSDALDRWQIDDHVRTALEWVHKTVQEALPKGVEVKPISYGPSPQIPPMPRAGGV